MRRILIAFLGALLLFGVVGLQPAAAQSERKLGTTLADLWKTALEPPDGPFNGGNPCVDLGGRVVAPFGSLGPNPITCTVAAGTKIFVAAVSWECSTVEAPPSYGANEAQLRRCARNGIAGYTRHSVTVDGCPVPVTKVETALIPLDLKAGNVLTGTPQQASSVAAGWVTLLHPLRPGTHQVVIHYGGTNPDGTKADVTNPTTIIVTRGR